MDKLEEPRIDVVTPYFGAGCGVLGIREDCLDLVSTIRPL